jgi:hypothetical protein
VLFPQGALQQVGIAGDEPERCEEARLEAANRMFD